MSEINVVKIFRPPHPPKSVAIEADTLEELDEKVEKACPSHTRFIILEELEMEEDVKSK